MKILKNILKAITSRFVIISFLILIQFAIFLVILLYFDIYFTYAHIVSSILSYLVLLYILNKDELSTYKIPWIIIVLLLPFAGSIAYILYGSIVLPKKIRRILQSEHDKIIDCLEKNPNIYKKLKEENNLAYGQATYISKTSKAVLDNASNITYYPIGEIMFEAMLKEIKKAEKYIFLEFFIFSEGEMLETLLGVLKEKASKGIEVRLIYDDVGSIKQLKTGFKKRLNKMGIKCTCFNPFIPIASNIHNNRDHRKILIIDGIVGFTGGINIADEYINKINRFGHWKDSGIMIRGTNVSNMIVMFLRNWNLYSNEKILEYKNYFLSEYPNYENSGYSLMFAAGPKPIYNDQIGENVYLNIINQAKKNICIMTPYFVVDHTMVNALTNASLRGVDVSIILPHIPDKRIVFMISKSYYFQLLKKGVKIYEYTPGFVHSKLVLCDNEIAVNGTINFDYRSFVHHFECACWMYNVKAIEEMYKDFQETLEKSEEIKIENVKKDNIIKRIFLAFLRFFSPLL